MSSASFMDESSTDIHAETRQKIDEEIAQLEARLLILKASRNTLAPFARLHPDVVQEIFVLASTNPMGRLTGKASLLISWVSQSWRNLALQTSELWSSIDFIHPQWIETALSRARNRPLSYFIHFRDRCPTDPEGVAAISLGNLHRIGRLSLGFPGIGYFVPRSPLWMTPAPLLTELSLSLVALPPNVFSAVFPSLEIVYLNRCDFDWASLPVHNGLRKLNIHSPVNRTSPHQLAEKLRILSPTVTHLSFSDTLLPTFQTLPPLLHRHDLAKLKSLRVTEKHGLSVTSVLNQISIPSHLDPVSVDTYDQDIATQLETAQAFVASRDMEKWAIDHFQVAIVDESFTIFVKDSLKHNKATNPGDSATENDYQMEDVDFQFTADVALGFNILDDGSNILPIIQSLPLEPVKTLTLSSNNFIDYGSELMDYFNTQGAVEWLNVSVHYLVTFLGTLRREARQLSSVIGTRQIEFSQAMDKGLQLDDHQQAQYRGTISFPCLTTLHYYGEADLDYQLHPPFFTILRDWLIWRKVLGLKLKMLMLRDMNVPGKSYLENLYEGLVDDFRCVRVEEMMDTE